MGLYQYTNKMRSIDERMADNFLRYYGEVSNSCNILIDYSKMIENEENISETIRVSLK